MHADGGISQRLFLRHKIRRLHDSGPILFGPPSLPLSYRHFPITTGELALVQALRQNVLADARVLVLGTRARKVDESSFVWWLIDPFDDVV